MRSPLRAASPVIVALALAAAAPGAHAAPPPAHASGGDVVELTYPSIVKNRVARTERALARAARKIENDKPDEAVRPLNVVRRKLAAAWRGAKYKIRTTPPPPPAEDARVRPRARTSGDGPTGPTYASPADTAFRVLTLQHDVAADVTQMIEDAPATIFQPLSETLSFTLDSRDGAIEDIVTLAPPAPSDDEDAGDARVHARASGDGPVVTTFDTVMPNVPPQLDDEIELMEEMKSDSTDLTPDGRGLLDAAETQIGKTKAVVNATWPPIPPED
jgi:hypothetical protein